EHKIRIIITERASLQKAVPFCMSSGFPGNTPEKAERRHSMGKKKEKPIDLRNLEPEEKLKYEVAEELGLLDKVMESGWRSLTSKETGRIGGLVPKKRRKEKEK